MKYLSLFSGIEAATVAWAPLGWKCAAVSEIEPFACSLLAYHYPNVPNIGDITEVTEQQIADLGQIDIVVFGSPCQDLSVAGKRKGLTGERSGLFHAAMRIIGWARKHCKTRYALWENVPGAFSSNAGRDFAAVVESMAGVAVEIPRLGWGTEGVALGQEGILEWAVLDAQWFGVAQRRRRIFAFADFGDWSSRPPILLESHRLRGGSAPSRVKSEAVAALTSCGVGTCGADDNQAQAGHLIPFAFTKQAIGEYSDKDIASTCAARDYKDATDLVVYGIPGNWIGRKPENGGNAVEPMLEVSPCQTSTDRHAVSYGWVVRRLTPTESERLQGFPDGYTKVPHKGKMAADSSRYKALGNSMAVPVMRWIGEQLEISKLI